LKTEDFIQAVEKSFGQDILSIEKRREKRLYVRLNPGAIVNLSGFMHTGLGMRFIIASAMHTRRGIEIVYHYSDDSSGNIINVQVLLDENNPDIESLTAIFPAADWIEREMHEIMGINFRNHPNLDKLLSEGNWAEGVYPYRKNEVPGKK
jgi:NADH-quinone oxidoreductase subunit C